MLSSKYIKFSKNFILNVIATGLPVAVLQLIVYPYIALKIDGNENGLMLTIYSLFMVVSNSLGNSLNNVRLVNNAKDNNNSNYNIVLKEMILINTVIVFVFVPLYLSYFDIYRIILCVFISLLVLFKAYIEVDFRIDFNYKNMLINGILMCLGYFVGCVFFSFSKKWEYIYVCAYFFCIIFNCRKSKKILLKGIKNENVINIKKQSYELVFANIANSISSYSDKLIIYPLMGGLSVSILHTATVFGKIIGMISAPASNVILSYLYKYELDIKSKIRKIFLLVLLLLPFIYFMVVLFTTKMVKILYSQWALEVCKLIPLTTLTAVINTLNSIINPFTMKYCKIEKQIKISVIGTIVYVIFSLLLWNFFGLYGFCAGAIIGELSKLIIMTEMLRKSV